MDPIKLIIVDDEPIIRKALKLELNASPHTVACGMNDDGDVQRRQVVVLDANRERAFQKLERINKLKQYLPGIDCGMCGAPTCEAFATDVVCKQIGLTRCVFYQKHLERLNDITRQETLAASAAVWGQDPIQD